MLSYKKTRTAHRYALKHNHGFTIYSVYRVRVKPN